MSFRHAPLRQHCRKCEAPGARACPCCQHAYCRRHAGRDDGWCDGCGEAYDRGKNAADGGTTALFYLGIPLLALGAGFSKRLAVVFVTFLVIGFPGLLMGRRALVRRRLVRVRRAEGRVVLGG